MISQILSLLLASAALPVDATSHRPKYNAPIPKLTLPWGTWEGKPYDTEGETVVFKNVRFGQAPTGPLRFAAPKYPEPIKDANEVQDSTYGPKCIQAKAKKNVTYEPIGEGEESEDCLFLDVYVPAWALEEPEDASLPVVVWIFGGAYIFGAKDAQFELKDGPFNAYDGQGIRDATDNGIIWVTGNYRLGAFGFLAGETIEKEAQPNAGLHDQRLLLDWVQKYIKQLGGDKDSVNVWGLSAGAGSILHHLTAYGGEKKEALLFHRAALWSTAFQWAYDRKGALDQTFKRFAKKVNCDSSNILKCLRKVDTEDLREANQKEISEQLQLGLFPFGPAVDGDLVPELPANLLKKGKHVNCSSIVISHDFDEVTLFVAQWVKTEEDFTKFVALAFPGDKYANIRKRIEEQYPAKNFDFVQNDRMRRVLRDSTFVCNKRQIYNAYHNASTVYTARYEMPPAQHGSDLFAIVWNREIDIRDLLKYAFLPAWMLDAFDSFWQVLATRYHFYFAGHALSGDPNLLRPYRGLQWEPTADDGNEFTNTLRIGMTYINHNHPFYNSGRDQQSSTENCAFWDEIAAEISKIDAKDAGTFVGFRDQSDGVASFEL